MSVVSNVAIPAASFPDHRRCRYFGFCSIFYRLKYTEMGFASLGKDANPGETFYKLSQGCRLFLEKRLFDHAGDRPILRYSDFSGLYAFRFAVFVFCSNIRFQIISSLLGEIEIKGVIILIPSLVVYAAFTVVSFINIPRIANFVNVIIINKF